jgi:hypothetical protein
LSVSNVMAHKSAGPSYKKPMRVNQGQFKPGTNRNLTWQKPVPSDNLVISFSDDDSGVDSEKTRQDRVRDIKASSQGTTQKTGNSMQTRIVREEASWQKTHGAKIGSTNFPAFSLSLRNTGAGRGSCSTFFRKELPLRQVIPGKPKQKDGNGRGVNSADHRLESLRHKIAAKENELKGQKRPMMPVATKNVDFNDQTRLPPEKKGFEANNSSDCSQLGSQFDHDARSNKRLKLSQQQSYNQVDSDLVTVAPINCSSRPGVNNVKSSEVINLFDNGVNMNCDVNVTEQTVTTKPSGQIQQGDATKNLPSSKICHKGTGAGNHNTVNFSGRLAAAPFTRGQSIPADTSALVPVTSSQTQQMVPPVGTSTEPNHTIHLEPGEGVSSSLFCHLFKYLCFFCFLTIYLIS